jgi:Zn-dependent protease with chaperone function
MNFFEHQDQARRKTGRLIVLFVLAVILILAAVNVATYGILRIASPHLSYMDDAAPVLRGDREYPGTLSPVAPLWNEGVAYAGVSLATLLVIAGGSAYKTASLSRGGHAVATLLGGRPLDPHSASGQDRVLQNVVEEMSIASGVPVPQVFVLENEESINAFAAGFTTEDAVLGFTRGCVDKLNRDELQGVVAHEFSHILNGDMRLNIRLIGILHGILVIALIGYAILRSLRYTRTSSRRDSKGGGNAVVVLLLAGAAMLVIGYVGVFFGRLIQSAVSRQREYLADASAVQFTRNPRGIAGALMKIGAFSAGSELNNHHAVETAHMFFSSGIKMSFSQFLATHPPLLDRIRRIDPTFDGRLPSLSDLAAREPVAARKDRPAAAAGGGPLPFPLPGRTGSHSPAAGAAAGFAGGLPRKAGAEPGRMALDPSTVVSHAGTLTPASVAYADQILEAIPPAVSEAAHDPYSARAVVLAMLLSPEPAVRNQQLQFLNSGLDPVAQRELRRIMDDVGALTAALRLPLLDLCLPSLRVMSPQQITRFRQIVRELVQVDRKISLFEYALLKILDRNLRLPDERARRGQVKYYAISGVVDHAAVLLAVLAEMSHGETAAAFASGAKRLDAQRPPPPPPKAGLAAVDAALTQLQFASPAVKQRVIDACAHTVAADGQVTPAEAELLRAIASTLDVPIPPVLSQAGAPQPAALAGSGAAPALDS